MSSDSGWTAYESLFSGVDHEVEYFQCGSTEQALGVFVAKKDGTGGLNVFNSYSRDASPVLPSLPWEATWANIRDALSAILELYREEGKPVYVISDEEARRITTEAYYPI